MAFTKVLGPGIHTLANFHSHNINSSGIITATKFIGDMTVGSGSTGTFSSLTVTGNLGVGGTLTYMDVTNVDAVGIITAQEGIHFGIGATAGKFLASTGIATFATLTVNNQLNITDKIVHSGNDGAKIRFPNTNTFSVETGSEERLRIDSDGRLLVGHNATIDTSTYNSKIQVMDTDAEASITVGRFSDDASASSIHLTKSRNAVIGNHGSGELHDNDVIGNIFWWGSDGGDYEEVARIGVNAGAAFTSGGTPGELSFWTTAANATTATERLRIESSGAMRLKSEYLRFQAGDHQVSDFSQKVGLKWTYETDIEIAKIEVSRPSWSGGPSDMLFHTCDTSGQVNERLRITTTGWQSGHAAYAGVGINTFASWARSGGAIRAEVGYNAVTLDYMYFGTGTLHPLALRQNNTTALFIDNNQRLLVGAETTVYKSNLNSSADTSGQLAQFVGAEDNTSKCVSIFAYSGTSNPTARGAKLQLHRARSTDGTTNTAVAVDDLIGSIEFKGNDATSFTASARIDSCVDSGTVGADRVPGNLKFYTSDDNTAVPQERFRLHKNGQVTMGNSHTPSSTHKMRVYETGGAGGIELLGDASSYAGQYVSGLTHETHCTTSENAKNAYMIHSTYHAEKTFAYFFPHDAVDHAVRIHFPDNSTWIAGYIRLNSTFSYENASGLLEYSFTLNGNGTTYYNRLIGEEVDIGNVDAHFSMSTGSAGYSFKSWGDNGGTDGEDTHALEIRRDGTNGGNWLYVTLELIGNAAANHIKKAYMTTHADAF